MARKHQIAFTYDADEAGRGKIYLQFTALACEWAHSPIGRKECSADKTLPVGILGLGPAFRTGFCRCIAKMADRFEKNGLSGIPGIHIGAVQAVEEISLFIINKRSRFPAFGEDAAVQNFVWVVDHARSFPRGRFRNCWFQYILDVHVVAICIFVRCCCRPCGDFR